LAALVLVPVLLLPLLPLLPLLSRHLALVEQAAAAAVSDAADSTAGQHQ
jgi:hypothetical protein